MLAASMGKFEGLSSSGQSINEMLDKLPKSIQTIFGTGGFDLTKASGYYGVLFMYFALMATIHAAMLGANIISKEEREKTAEFLLVKPTSRYKIISAKLAAATLNIVIFNLITLISSIGLVNKMSKGETVTGEIVRLMIGMLFLQFIFLSIGTGIAAMTKNPKLSAALSTGILLITFILSIVVDLNNKLEGLKYLSPFKYFDAKIVMYSGGLKPIYIMLSIIIVGALIASTYIFYNKRDLSI
jgi:ABC-2 type transport system permease protein